MRVLGSFHSSTNLIKKLKLHSFTRQREYVSKKKIYFLRFNLLFLEYLYFLDKFVCCYVFSIYIHFCYASRCIFTSRYLINNTYKNIKIISNLKRIKNLLGDVTRVI